MDKDSTENWSVMKSYSSFSDVEVLETELTGCLTASNVIEHLFCPRFTYFELYLKIPEHEEKRFKVEKGRTIHEERKKINPHYLRKKIGCTKREFSVYLSSHDGWKGIVDEVLELEDGTMAPLDYKYAEYKDTTFGTHRYQLVYYGKLIQDHYGKLVNRGFIIYTRSNNKLVEVPINESDYDNLRTIIAEIKEIIQTGKYPKSTAYKTACLDCCYKNICEMRV